MDKRTSHFLAVIITLILRLLVALIEDSWNDKP